MLFSSYRLLYFDSEACTKRKGAVDLSVAEAVDALRDARRAAERRAEGTPGALNPQLSYPHQHHAHHSHESTIIHCADCDFACARLAPRPRLTGAVFACVILAWSLFPHTNLRAQLSVLGCLRSCPVMWCACHVCT